MPRLFPHLGRSSKEQAAGYGAYDPYYGHPGRGYDYDSIDYEPQQPPHTPAWRKMLSKGSGSSSNTKSSGTRTGGSVCTMSHHLSIRIDALKRRPTMVKGRYLYVNGLLIDGARLNSELLCVLYRASSAPSHVLTTLPTVTCTVPTPHKFPATQTRTTQSRS